MHVIEGASSAAESPNGVEMTRWEHFLSVLTGRLIRLRRKLPYLVWWDDELDVTVTLSQDKLDPERGMEQLWKGAFFDAEKIFSEMGIKFDTGMGEAGRDWEWDFSLRGPINVRFRRRAERPERRLERLNPRLVALTAGQQGEK